MKKSIVDNADYVPQQISFLDDSGNVRSDYVYRFVPRCFICKKFISRFHPVIYSLALGEPRRICKVCHENYKQTFDIGKTRKMSRRGDK